jgi:hypothetical protein
MTTAGDAAEGIDPRDRFPCTWVRSRAGGFRAGNRGFIRSEEVRWKRNCAQGVVNEDKAT